MVDFTQHFPRIQRREEDSEGGIGQGMEEDRDREAGKYRREAGKDRREAGRDMQGRIEGVEGREGVWVGERESYCPATVFIAALC